MNHAFLETTGFIPGALLIPILALRRRLKLFREASDDKSSRVRENGFSDEGEEGEKKIGSTRLRVNAD